jgi:hypothetical protein
MSVVVRRSHRTAVAGVAADQRRAGGKLSLESPVHVPQTAPAEYGGGCGGCQGGPQGQLARTLAMKPGMLVIAVIASVLVFWGPLALCLWHWWMA